MCVRMLLVFQEFKFTKDPRCGLFLPDNHLRVGGGTLGIFRFKRENFIYFYFFILCVRIENH